MGRLNFGRPTTPPIAHHLNDDSDVVDGCIAEGLQHGLLAEPKVDAKSFELESTDPLGFQWRVPLS